MASGSHDQQASFVHVIAIVGLGSRSAVSARKLLQCTIVPLGQSDTVTEFDAYEGERERERERILKRLFVGGNMCWRSRCGLRSWEGSERPVLGSRRGHYERFLLPPGPPRTVALGSLT